MRQTGRLHEVGFSGNGERLLQCPAVREGNYIWTICDLETQLWKIIHSCSLQSKWSFPVHVLSLLLQDSEIWAIRVKQLIGLLACLTWFMQYYLLLDTDFSQFFRQSRERSAAVRLCSAEMKRLDIVRAFKRLNIISDAEPKTTTNSFEWSWENFHVIICLSVSYSLNLKHGNVICIIL